MSTQSQGSQVNLKETYFALASQEDTDAWSHRTIDRNVYSQKYRNSRRGYIGLAYFTLLNHLSLLEIDKLDREYLDSQFNFFSLLQKRDSIPSDYGQKVIDFLDGLGFSPVLINEIESRWEETYAKESNRYILRAKQLGQEITDEYYYDAVRNLSAFKQWVNGLLDGLREEITGTTMKARSDLQKPPLLYEDLELLNQELGESVDESSVGNLCWKISQKFQALAGEDIVTKLRTAFLETLCEEFDCEIADFLIVKPLGDPERTELLATSSDLSKSELAQVMSPGEILTELTSMDWYYKGEGITGSILLIDKSKYHEGDVYKMVGTNNLAIDDRQSVDHTAAYKKLLITKQLPNFWAFPIFGKSGEKPVGIFRVVNKIIKEKETGKYFFVQGGWSGSELKALAKIAEQLNSVWDDIIKTHFGDVYVELLVGKRPQLARFRQELSLLFRLNEQLLTPRSQWESGPYVIALDCAPSQYDRPINGLNVVRNTEWPLRNIAELVEKIKKEPSDFTPESSNELNQFDNEIYEYDELEALKVMLDNDWISIKNRVERRKIEESQFRREFIGNPCIICGNEGEIIGWQRWSPSGRLAGIEVASHFTEYYRNSIVFLGDPTASTLSIFADGQPVAQLLFRSGRPLTLFDNELQELTRVFRDAQVILEEPALKLALRTLYEQRHIGTDCVIIISPEEIPDDLTIGKKLCSVNAPWQNEEDLKTLINSVGKSLDKCLFYLSGSRVTLVADENIPVFTKWSSMIGNELPQYMLEAGSLDPSIKKFLDLSKEHKAICLAVSGEGKGSILDWKLQKITHFP